MFSRPSISYIVEIFSTGITRFRHPFTLPVEMGTDLGWELTNRDNFLSLIQKIAQGRTPPKNLRKFMTREEALSVFRHPCRTESFHHKMICSYYFKQGWLEFELLFDNQNRLRRVSLQAPTIKSDLGVEIPLQAVI